MTAPSGRVVRNVHHGTRVTTADAPVAEADGGAVERAVEFSTPFDYLFDTLAGKFPDKHLPGDAATVVSRLKALGRAMIENEPPQGDELEATGNSTIPPVYTYWGQFIDHDITLNTDSNKSVSDITQPDLGPLTPAFVTTHLRNGRQPALNLDSLYGDGPTFPGGPQTEAAALYEDDGVRLRLSPVVKVPESFSDLIPPVDDDRRDLFRDTLNAAAPTEAVIGDSRNDENLVVAQLHVAFVKFHNAVVHHLETQPDPPTDPAELFARARRLVTWHYQWLVAHDYLKTVTQTGVADKVLLGGNTVYAPRADGPYMPLEFSAAVFRFGHSMVRGFYDYNRNFGRRKDDAGVDGPGRVQPFATFEQLFAFTGSAHGPDGAPRPFDGRSQTTLPSNWVIEWDRFVDKGAVRPDHFARRIDTRLAPPLFDMLNQVSGGEASFPAVLRELLARLAVRNLLRGYSLALPTGQAVAEELGITPLTPAQLRSGNTASFNTVLADGGFETATPLWYYVLKEAEVLANGNSLGPVGSRIVAETLIGQLRADPESFLNAPADWSPEQGVLLPDGSPIVSIGDLFRFAGVL